MAKRKKPIATFLQTTFPSKGNAAFGFAQGGMGTQPAVATPPPPVLPSLGITGGQPLPQQQYYGGQTNQPPPPTQQFYGGQTLQTTAAQPTNTSNLTMAQYRASSPALQQSLFVGGAIFNTLTGRVENGNGIWQPYYVSLDPNVMWLQFGGGAKHKGQVFTSRKAYETWSRRRKLNEKKNEEDKPTGGSGVTVATSTLGTG
jgi:hypothetical protein